MASKDSERERWVTADFKRIACVFVVATLFRACIGIYSLDRLDDDPDAYRALAATINSDGVFGLVGADGQPRATAFRPPLYPWLLSQLFIAGNLSDVAVALMHAVLGGLSVALIFVAGQRVTGSARGAALGAIWVAVDPILVSQSTVLMTETLAVCLTAAGVAWWTARPAGESSTHQTATAPRHDYRWAATGGLIFSLAFLCRPTFLVWAIAMTLGMLHRSSRSDRSRRSWAMASLCAAIVIGCVAAWTWRNLGVTGHPIWATTHGGYTLLLGNNPLIYDHVNGKDQSSNVWNPTKFLTAYDHRYQADPRTESFWYRDWSPGYQVVAPDGATEVSDDRLAYEAATSTIKRRPIDFIKACASRLVSLWTPFPQATSGRGVASIWAVGIFYLGTYAAVIFGAIRLWRSGRPDRVRWIWPAATMCLTLSLVHTFYWSNVRMRAPVIPALAIVAAGVCAGRRDEPTSSLGGR